MTNLWLLLRLWTYIYIYICILCSIISCQLYFADNGILILICSNSMLSVVIAADTCCC